MTHAPGAPPTILIVQHDALVAMMLEDALAGAGYRTVWSPDGRRTAAAHAPGPEPAVPPRAAVVDLRLADGVDGRAVLRRLRARFPAMPVVAVTGFQPQAPEADLRGLGGPIARVGKPFDWEELLGRLAGVLGGPAAAQTGPRRRASDAAAAARAG